MRKYTVLEKQIGETPLSATEKFRAETGLLKNVPLAYAGRLDPMASGKLLVLIGDECKKQKSYFKLDKEYSFEILFGFESDTKDVLGMAKYKQASTVSDKSLREVAKKFVGEISLPYPHFSSKTVRGKPLHMWTLEGRLDEIKIPTKNSTVYALQYKNSRAISKATLQKQIFEKINSIPKVTEKSKEPGRDFRREDIRAKWLKLFENTDQTEFQVATFLCVASSGTYMRTLAEEISKELKIKGLAFSIHRSKIGKYQKISKKLGFWRKIYT